MKKYYIAEDNGVHNHAGTKGRNDIDSILISLGFCPLPIRKQSKKGLNGRALKLWLFMQDWLGILKHLDKNSHLVIQVPIGSGQYYVAVYLMIIRRLFKPKITMLIHGLDSLRGVSHHPKLEILLLKQADHVICHNEKMKQALIDRAIDSRRLIPLRLFDYLMEPAMKSDLSTITPIIFFAGNLEPSKAGFIYKLRDLRGDLVFNLYGPNYAKTLASKLVSFRGEFSPAELTCELLGSFGLVWDGDSLDTCSGAMGEYLKINCPNKICLYLAAGFPVIVWSQAAIADYVREEQVGIAVNSLRDLPEVLAGIDDDQYAQMKQNAQRVSEKIRNGYYTKTALERISSIERVGHEIE